MKSLCASALSLCLLVSPVAAQTSDTDRILQAIQSLSDKIDGLQNEIDALQGQLAPPEPGSEGAAPAKAAVEKAAPSSDGPTAEIPKSVPGWMVDVMPFVNDGKAYRLFRFNAPSAAVGFGAHRSVRPITDNVWHQGSAKLNIYEPGQYGFLIEIDTHGAESANKCFTSLKIGEQSVFDVDIGHLYSNRVFQFNGSIELQKGSYDISYSVGCGYQYDTPRFQKGQYSVFILGPDDNEPRYFKANELFTLRAQ